MNKAEFNEAFVEMVSHLTQMEDTAISGLDGAADRLCSGLRIAFLDVKQFRNFRSEEQDDGRSLIFYQSGQPHGEEFIRHHRVAENRTIIRYRAYPAEHAEPWSEIEREQIALVLNTIYHFNSRSRVMKIINEFTYYDPAGYRNLRFFMRYLWDLSAEGTLTRMNSFQLNLKHFGIVNQQLGRMRGDVVMHSFYEQMQSLLGDAGWICRMGGDNFIILAEKRLTSTILHFLAGTGIVFDSRTGKKIMISANVGVFEIPLDFTLSTESEIMDPTMSSSLAARHSSTTDVVFYSEQMLINKQNMMKIQQAFPESLEKGEFLVYYQPKVTMDGKDLGGAEALCRWKHNGRIIAPNDFIPILESGMEICRLDFHMLDSVCRDIRRWMDTGKQIVRISVNFSRRHMVDMQLLEHITEIVDRHQVPHEYIEIELTETTTDVEFEDLKRIVTGLQAAGFCTSVDDFGIGYSSLKLIKEIPWNVLKVDKSFLPDMDEDPGSRRSVMFRHVISMARELGLKCITEGVETAEQVRLLCENHCEMAQGYFYDKPLPVTEFEKRLESKHYTK